MSKHSYGYIELYSEKPTKNPAWAALGLVVGALYGLVVVYAATVLVFSF